MRTVYIDADFKCHATNPEGAFRAVETARFDGKCDKYVEGFRFVPEGSLWTRSDGETFEGEMIAPHTDFNKILIAQLEFEKADAENALAILLGGASE